ncbi:MAG: hypothetical protein ACQES4_10365 [Bacillota bacterium]
MRGNKLFMFVIVILLVGVFVMTAYASSVTFINNDTGNYIPITKVTLEVDGDTMEQSSSYPDGPPKVKTGKPIKLISLEVNDGGLVKIAPFNTSGAVVKLQGLSTESSEDIGVIVPDNGNYSLVRHTTDNEAYFRIEAEKTFQNLNLNNYIFYDDSDRPQEYTGNSDFDVIYETPLKADDYVVVMERWGNSHFQITPLNQAGDIIVEANTLHFGKATWSNAKVYQWNTGHAHNNYIPHQSYWLMVAKVSQFFNGSYEEVYGFAIENRGEADIKLFTFQKLPPVPCTVYTQGYWRNKGYKDGWPAPPVIAEHPEISYENFFGHGSWIDVLRTPPRGGDAFYILAHQFIAAHLNMQLPENETCVIPEEVKNAYTEALNFFHGNGGYSDYNKPGDLTGRMNKDKREDRAAVLGWAETLDSWNNGL